MSFKLFRGIKIRIFFFDIIGIISGFLKLFFVIVVCFFFNFSYKFCILIINFKLSKEVVFVSVLVIVEKF